MNLSLMTRFLFCRAKKYIPLNHECIQLLHHASVFDLNLVLLLIGDRKRTILRGVWVNFSTEIKTAYQSFLRMCYEKCLLWAYDGYENELAAEQSENALNALKPLLSPGLDFESFKDFYMLWKQATCSPSRHLPIPRTQKIIPYHFSLWNKFKGGSDTTLTKLFWNAKHYVPSLSPASNAISQLFRFMAVTLYRCDAVMSSNENLDRYPTLESWRHSNQLRNKSFQHFLREITSNYLNEPEPVRESSAPTVVARTSRNRVAQVEATWASEQTCKTPGKNAEK